MIDGSLHVVNKGARDQKKHLLGFLHIICSKPKKYAPRPFNIYIGFSRGTFSLTCDCRFLNCGSGFETHSSLPKTRDFCLEKFFASYPWKDSSFSTSWKRYSRNLLFPWQEKLTHSFQSRLCCEGGRGIGLSKRHY